MPDYSVQIKQVQKRHTSHKWKTKTVMAHLLIKNQPATQLIIANTKTNQNEDLNIL